MRSYASRSPRANRYTVFMTLFLELSRSKTSISFLIKLDCIDKSPPEGFATYMESEAFTIWVRSVAMPIVKLCAGMIS